METFRWFPWKQCGMFGLCTSGVSVSTRSKGPGCWFVLARQGFPPSGQSARCSSRNTTQAPAEQNINIILYSSDLLSDKQLHPIKTLYFQCSWHHTVFATHWTTIGSVELCVTGPAGVKLRLKVNTETFLRQQVKKDISFITWRINPPRGSHVIRSTIKVLRHDVSITNILNIIQCIEMQSDHNSVIINIINNVKIFVYVIGFDCECCSSIRRAA